MGSLRENNDVTPSQENAKDKLSPSLILQLYSKIENRRNVNYVDFSIVCIENFTNILEIG